MAQHSRYWSCSPFADWVRGTPKLGAGTSEEWDEWEQIARTSHPARYWIAEELLGKLQDFVTWPLRKVLDGKYYLVNRYVSKTHALTSNLERGGWHDARTRMLHCPFDELLNFVEVETAWHQIAWGSEENKIKYNAPWNATGMFRIRTWRCPQAGVDHLLWAADLKLDESMGVEPGSENYGQPTYQAIEAKEILDLYRWWKFTRPERPDPYDISGWSSYCAKLDRKHKRLFGSRTPEERAESGKLLDKLHRIEEEYENEDTEMLCRLMKIRRSLWT